MGGYDCRVDDLLRLIKCEKAKDRALEAEEVLKVCLMETLRLLVTVSAYISSERGRDGAMIVSLDS